MLHIEVDVCILRLMHVYIEVDVYAEVAVSG